MSDVETPPNVCYRHPDRQSYVLCQRCGRTICPQCQIPAAVGVHCPECVREAHAETARRSGGARRPVARVLRGSFGRGQWPVVTLGIIAVCVVVWLLEILPGVGSYVQYYGVYYPPLTASEPWRMLTAVFLHSPSLALHLFLNMLSLWFLGPALESMLGRSRYLALFLIAGFGGSVAVLLLAPDSAVYGASGAIFGMMAAYFIIARRLGAGGTQILVVIGLNLAIGFMAGSVSWQAHVGGLITGGAVALVLVTTRRRSQRAAQLLGLAGIVVVLVAITLVGVARL
ncbi:MAG: rhomboid family intramembrane serine protease [Microbacteriaceae bacterium]